uniref:uncharacterized protein LOC105352587 n=1 Tax=Fragaria vesca subsp. vesca TaxID=101020 RepID=UPI0005C9ABE8|nr:PREDICTED: uncharacterized protein LOC105352587 [Fragaria vesca subsp. vesca]
MENRVLVDFRLLKMSVCYDDIRRIHTECSWSTGATNIPFSNDYLNPEFSELIKFMATNLSILEVPQEEHRTILDKLYEVVQVLHPERRIVVFVTELTISFLGSFCDFDTLFTRTIPFPVTLQFGGDDHPDEWVYEIYELNGFDYHGVIDTTVLQESFEALTLKFIPATRSSIESLQKVRLDILEQAVIKQISACSICKDEFAEDSFDQLITPLPCAHHFHVDCISLWLETSHLCPMCRYALPIVEEAEPLNS